MAQTTTLNPFCGSCAVLLARPGYDPQRHTETVVDADGHIANVWRSLQADPDEVARWCDWPVNHADLIARKKRLNLNTESLLERLCADDAFFDAKLAGYYIWAASCWIGHGLIRPNQRPHLTAKGMGVHKQAKPPIYDWFRQLSERLRHVRVVCGDWSRVCGGNWQDSNWPTVGMFFDPPYSDKADRDSGLYAVDSLDVAHDVRQWCIERGRRANYRIVLAGYTDEHAELLDHGWTTHQWSAGGGYGNIARNGETRGEKNRHKETLFLSPHCLTGQMGLFD